MLVVGDARVEVSFTYELSQRIVRLIAAAWRPDTDNYTFRQIIEELVNLFI